MRDDVSVKESHPVSIGQDRNLSGRVNSHQFFFERAKIDQMKLPIIANTDSWRYFELELFY
jgi:hypothetical protein